MRSNLISDGQDDDCYRPQRSWGKVIFSQASVILSTGGSTWAGNPQTRYTPGTRCKVIRVEYAYNHIQVRPVYNKQR